ncbi:MAG: hypothetical protein ACQEQ4_00175 [Fibrobacterota bacterium]
MNTGRILQKQIILLTSLTMLLLTLGLFITIGGTLYKELEKAENNNILHAGRIRSITISQWFGRVASYASQIASRSAIRDALDSYAQDSLSLEDLRSFSTPKLRDALQASTEIMGLTRTDLQGTTITSIGENHMEKAGDLHVLPGKNISFSDPFYHNEEWLMVLKNPIQNSGNESIGYDLITINLHELHRIISDREGLGQKSSIFLISAVNDTVEFLSNPERTDWNQEFFTDLSQNNHDPDFFPKGLLAGEKYVICRIPLSMKRWSLVVLQDTKELYNEIETHLFRTGIFSLIILTGFFGILFYFLRPLTKHILLEYRELKSQIAEKTRDLEHENREKDRANAQLQEKIEQINTLQGLIPICANCKRIRDDSGYWEQLEEYFSKQSEARFSHGICPDCMKKLYDL